MPYDVWQAGARLMRVLLVSNTFPADSKAVHGVYQRLGTFVRALRGHRIEALFFVPRETDTGADATRAAAARLADAWEVDLDLELCSRAHVEPSRWNAYFAGLFDMARQPRYRAASGPEQVAAVRRRLDSGPDAVFVHRLVAMAPMLALAPPRWPVFFDLDDVEHVAFERKIRTPPLGPGKRLLRLQLPALRRGERRAIRRSAVTFVCSDRDRDYLRERYRTAAVETVPNSVPIPAADALVAPAAGPPGVLFLGNFAHPPNRAAAERLASRIWPDVRARVPTARLVLAGPRPELLSCCARPPEGVELPGFIDDLGGLYRSIRVVCAPISAGGGTRVKLLEAGAWGRAVVATGIAAEGIGFEDGVHYLRREDDAALADACAEMLLDGGRSAALGAAARELVRTRYSRESVIESIRDLLAARGLPAAPHLADRT